MRSSISSLRFRGRQAPEAESGLENSRTPLVSGQSRRGSGSTTPLAGERGRRANILRTWGSSDINAFDNFGCTRLNHALKNGDLEEVKNLLKRGALAWSQNKDGTSPLHNAVSVNSNIEDTMRLEFIEVLLQALEKNDINAADAINQPDRMGYTPFVIAIQKGFTDAALRMLEHGADAASPIKTGDSIGWTPMLLAACKANAQVLEAILNVEPKPDINCSTPRRSTALHLAAKSGNTNCVKLLIGHDADIHAIDDQKWTPLHFAVRNGNTDCVSLLIEHGANIDAATDKNWTPLHWAAHTGHTDCVRLLIDANANPSLYSKEGLLTGYKPGRLASRAQKHDIAAMLEEAEAKYAQSQNAQREETMAPLLG